jgi:hypothetical protein
MQGHWLLETYATERKFMKRAAGFNLSLGVKKPRAPDAEPTKIKHKRVRTTKEKAAISN